MPRSGRQGRESLGWTSVTPGWSARSLQPTCPAYLIDTAALTACEQRLGRGDHKRHHHYTGEWGLLQEPGLVMVFFATHRVPETPSRASLPPSPRTLPGMTPILWEDALLETSRTVLCRPH